MNLTDPAQLQQLLERHGLTPQKRWGQHFLRATSIVDAIVSRFHGFKGILEVGPGPGVLTAPLSQQAERVIALEVDPIAISALAESAPTADVRHVDALKADLGSILAELPQPRALVSNMPYNITGPLLTAFASARQSYGKAVLMIQKEVGDRVLAEPGDSNCGSLSIFLQSQFAIARVCNAPAGAFYPPPKVASVVLELVPRSTGMDSEQEARFFKLVRAGFTQPRKTLANNLFASLGIDRELIESVLCDLSLSTSARPHQLSVEDWKRLCASPLS